MAGPKYVPPHLRGAPAMSPLARSARALGAAPCEPAGPPVVLYPLGAAHRAAAAELLVGRHMNSQGGSWSAARIAARLDDSVQDWGRRWAGEALAPGAADGVYWLARRRRGAAVGVVGFHRAPGDSIYAFRAYFGPAAAEPEQLAAIRGALVGFAQSCPEQAVAWTHVRGAYPADGPYLRAGFTFVSAASIPRGAGRRTVSVFSIPLAVAGLPAASRLHRWMAPASPPAGAASAAPASPPAASRRHRWTPASAPAASVNESEESGLVRSRPRAGRPRARGARPKAREAVRA